MYVWPTYVYVMSENHSHQNVEFVYKCYIWISDEGSFYQMSEDERDVINAKLYLQTKADPFTPSLYVDALIFIYFI